MRSRFCGRAGRAVRFWGPLCGLFSIVGLALVACLSPPLEGPRPLIVEATHYTFPQTLHNKVDILFMIDNSGSMESMQTELKNRFGQFFKPFQDLADQGTYADLHIGVVTSDYGAGASGATGCSPSGFDGGGDKGRLIAVGKKAMASCQKPKGANFIQYKLGETTEHNLPQNQNLLETFTCMASIGSQGCGFEHQLESVYAALHNNIPENAGFLRDDALLVVVFVTNEDDSSAPPDSDVFDKNQTAMYGYQNSYSRQTRFGVMCGEPATFPPYGDSNGALAKCVPAPNPDGTSGPGKLYDVRRYQDFFNLPRLQGGVKDSPLDVVLIGIDAPEDPFQVLLSNPNTPAGQPVVQCPQLNETSNPPCVPVLQHSCVNPQNMNFFGDPAVRLNAVIKSARQHAVTSICENDYTPALDGAAKLVVSQLGFGCIKDPFPRDAASQLVIDCTVQEVTLNPDASDTRTRVERCDAASTRVPCWKIEPKEQCADFSPDSIGFTIVRGERDGKPVEAPPHTTALVECATSPDHG